MLLTRAVMPSLLFRQLVFGITKRMPGVPKRHWQEPVSPVIVSGGIDGLCLLPACADGIELTPVEADECRWAATVYRLTQTITVSPE